MSGVGACLRCEGGYIKSGGQHGQLMVCGCCHGSNHREQAFLCPLRLAQQGMDLHRLGVELLVIAEQEATPADVMDVLAFRLGLDGLDSDSLAGVLGRVGFRQARFRSDIKAINPRGDGLWQRLDLAGQPLDEGVLRR